jgi:hypothetical protein
MLRANSDSPGAAMAGLSEIRLHRWSAPHKIIPDHGKLIKSLLAASTYRTGIAHRIFA